MGIGSWAHDILLWIKRHGDRKFGGRGMNLVFKNSDAAAMLIKTADAECRFKLVGVAGDTASLQLIVTVDGNEVMLADSVTQLYVGDTVALPGAAVTIRVS
jgi:hypothetical protein